MTRLLPATLLVGAVLMGCAARKRDTAPAPAWTTPDGMQQARLDMVQLALDAGNPDGALTLLAKLRDEGARGPEIDLVHGRALVATGLFDDATEMLNGVPKRSAVWPAAQAELGLLAMERKDVDEAVRRFKAATGADPDRATYWNNLGFCLMARGEYSQAIDALRRSLALDSSQPKTRNNLGFALLAADREAEAFRVFRAGSSEAGARYNLGVGYEIKGDLSAAAAAYQQSLGADPAYSNARVALDRLQPGSRDPSSYQLPLESP